jgi:hypothetical protein
MSEDAVRLDPAELGSARAMPLLADELRLALTLAGCTSLDDSTTTQEG